MLMPVLCLLLAATCGKDHPKDDPGIDISVYSGLVINEVAAHDQAADAESWVEIANTSSKAVPLEGLGLYVSDEWFTNQRIWTPSAGARIGAGEKLVLSTSDGSLVTGVSSAAQFVLKLAVEDGRSVAEFDRSKAFTDPSPAFARGSYQRIPDGTGEWRNLPYSSKGETNTVFSIDDASHTAIWAWSSHVSDMMASDAAKLKNLKTLGYNNIILNYAAFQYGNKKATIEFIEKCEELGIAVHAWMQCFYKNGSWINPINDEEKTYKEDVFADIREQARTYIEEFGVKGLHLDYIRFGGTASKHDVSDEVNSVGAVNRCCKEVREVADSYSAGIVTSAALMPEPDTEYAYGQSPSQMGRYIHLLMPMLYRYTYGWSDARCKSLTNWFASNSGDAEVWAGITTYRGNDSGVTPMDAASIRADVDIFLDSDAKGLVLFRYGLGTFPDVNDLKI